MTPEELRPCLDKVLLRMDDPEALTVSGLVIPEAHAEEVQVGTVVAVGCGSRHGQGTREDHKCRHGHHHHGHKHDVQSIDVEPGDRVAIRPKAGMTLGDLQIDDEGHHLFVRERDILCVIEE
jgi:co-chaperonin GroES (HSP10)